MAVGYSGSRPARSAEARELIRKLRQAPAAASKTRAALLDDVERLIDELACLGARARFDGQTLAAMLKDAGRYCRRWHGQVDLRVRTRGVMLREGSCLLISVPERSWR